mmetsp:Transcript_26827/g.76591  ORF Transcript_26827/g.76591 Transcript_26827/m.76591 type:complete len:243 (-) Transcript_26827:233-961(-)
MCTVAVHSQRDSSCWTASMATATTARQLSPVRGSSRARHSHQSPTSLCISSSPSGTVRMGAALQRTPSSWVQVHLMNSTGQLAPAAWTACSRRETPSQLCAWNRRDFTSRVTARIRVRSTGSTPWRRSSTPQAPLPALPPPPPGRGNGDEVFGIEKISTCKLSSSTEAYSAEGRSRGSAMREPMASRAGQISSSKAAIRFSSSCSPGVSMNCSSALISLSRCMPRAARKAGSWPKLRAGLHS